MHEKIVVFVGPSLLIQEVGQRLPQAKILPPAQKGSVFSLIGKGVEKVVIVDGLFYACASIWHREILAAMDAGIAIYGAASIGALRAAELHSYGMQGIGWIFNQYLEGAIDGDDEVSLLHHGADFDYANLSIPLVNLRFALQQALDDGSIAQEEAKTIVREVKAQPFYDRTHAFIRSNPILSNLASVKSGHIFRLLADGSNNVKANDARLVLEAVVNDSVITQATVPRDPHWQLRPDYIISAIEEHSSGLNENGVPPETAHRLEVQLLAAVLCAIDHFSHFVLCLLTSESLPPPMPLQGESRLTHGVQTLLEDSFTLISVFTSHIVSADVRGSISVDSFLSSQPLRINLKSFLLLGWLLKLNQCHPPLSAKPFQSNKLDELVSVLPPGLLDFGDILVHAMWFCEKSPDYFGLSSWRDPVFCDAARLAHSFHRHLHHD